MKLILNLRLGNLIGLLLLCSLLCASCSNQETTEELTALQVIQRHYEERGGIERLQQVESLHRLGEIRLPGPDGTEILGMYESWVIPPDRIRIDFYLEYGGYFVQGYDGKTAWQIDEHQWVRELTGPEVQQLAAQAAQSGLETQYLDLARNGPVARLGKTTIKRPEFKYKRFYRIRFGEDSLNCHILYVDASSFLWVRKDVYADGKLVLRRDVPTWSFKDGIAIWGKWEEYTGDGRLKYRINLLDFEVNSPSAGSVRFHLPDSETAGAIIDEGMARIGVSPSMPDLDR